VKHKLEIIIFNEISRLIFFLTLRDADADDEAVVWLYPLLLGLIC
jgi:hypothetical protein